MRRLLILLALLFVLSQLFVSLPQPQAFTDPVKLTAADGMSGDVFGASVSISGETAIVGAYTSDVGSNPDQGAAYVFLRSGASWIQQAKLTASDGSAGDFFGLSVAVDGDTAVIGAEQHDVGSNTNQGAAYVFLRSGTTWTQQAKLVAADGSDLFGHSVSISGDTVIIGAYLNTVGTNATQGAAYVFLRSGASWIQQAKLVAADGTPNDHFGTSVAIDGETAMVGAPQQTGGQGSAYVFVRSGTSWTQQAKLTADDGMSGDVFGYSVSISGDTSLIGAFGDDVGSNTNQGAAYAFVRSGASWIQQAKLTADDGMANDVFANAVGISGDIAIVGPVNREAVYVFSRSGASWTQQPKLTAADGQIGDTFGVSVAIDGETVIIGAYLDDIGSNANQGSAYIFAPTTGAVLNSWAMFGHDAQHTGVTSIVGPQNFNTPTIKSFLNQTIGSSVVIDANGVVYVLTVGIDNIGRLYAYNADGSAKAGFPFESPIGNVVVTSPAVTSDGTVYAAFGNNLYALNSTGQPVWASPFVLQSAPQYSPVIGADGRIFVIGGDLYAVNANGTQAWRAQGVYGMPSLGTDGTIFCPGGPTVPISGGFTALNADGTVKWVGALALPGTNVSFKTPVVGTDGSVYALRSVDDGVSIVSQGIVRLSPLTGAVIDQVSVPSPTTQFGLPLGLTPNGTILYTTGTGHLLGFSPDLATVRFDYSFASTVFCTPPAVGADGTIYIAGFNSSNSSSNKFIALSQNGSLKWEYSLVSNQPTSGAIAPDGSLYFAAFTTNEGGQKLYAFKDVVSLSPVLEGDIGVWDGHLWKLDGVNIVSLTVDARPTNSSDLDPDPVSVPHGTAHYVIEGITAGHTYDLTVELVYTDFIFYDSGSDCGPTNAGCKGIPSGEPKKATLTIQNVACPNRNADLKFPLPLVMVHGVLSCYDRWYVRDGDPDLWDNYARSQGYISFTPNYRWRMTDTNNWEQMTSQVFGNTESNLYGLISETTSGHFPQWVYIGHSQGGLIARVAINRSSISPGLVSSLRKVFLLGTPNTGSYAPNILRCMPYLSGCSMETEFNIQYPSFGPKDVTAYGGYNRLKVPDDGVVTLSSAHEIRFAGCCGVFCGETVRQCIPGCDFRFRHDRLGAPDSREAILSGQILPSVCALIGGAQCPQPILCETPWNCGSN